jgi:hypothetical protein
MKFGREAGCEMEVSEPLSNGVERKHFALRSFPMAGQNRIIDVHTFRVSARLKITATFAKEDAAQSGRSPYWEMWAS